MNDPQYIIVHTVAKKGITTKEEIDEMHKKRGFRGFGYHYYIRKDGTREKGREESEQGAHCLEMGMNRKSIGVCMEGHGNYETWTPEQDEEFTKLALELMHRYAIPASNIMGHRETGAPKDCPGKLVDMTALRNHIETKFVRPNINS